MLTTQKGLPYDTDPTEELGRDLAAAVWWGSKGFLGLSSFGGQTGPSYLGDGDKERKLMHQGRLGPGGHAACSF